MQHESSTEDERAQPCNIDAEKSALGAVLLDPTFDTIEKVRALGLEPGDFWSPAHRFTYESMAKLADAGEPLDFVTLCDAISEAGNLDSVGGRSAVSALINGSMRPANVASHVAIILEKAKRRRIIKTAEAMAQQAADPGADASTVLTTASNALELVQGSDFGALQLRPVALCEADPEPVPLIRQTGDHFGSVVAVGEVGILTGAGKVGKSTLARQLGVAASAYSESPNYWQEVAGLDVRGVAVALVTYEDSNRRTFESCRMLAAPDPIPDGLHVMQAQGHPMFGVAEGASVNSRPQRLPAWFQIWAQIRQAGIGLVIIDPLGSAFMANTDSQSGARAFIEALRIEADRAGCGVLLVAHPTKGARHVKADAKDPGQVSGSAAFSDAARSVMVLTPELLSCETANYSKAFKVLLSHIEKDGRFIGFKPSMGAVTGDA